jgi:hypothetical protein
VVRSFLDQLVRGNGLAAARTTEIARVLDQAERATAGVRRLTLTALATDVERDATGARDAERVRAMARAIRDLAAATR